MGTGLKTHEDASSLQVSIPNISGYLPISRRAKLNRRELHNPDLSNLWRCPSQRCDLVAVNRVNHCLGLQLLATPVLSQKVS